ncbi:MAG: PIN domain-containing protein [Bacteroidota bacterium]
MIRIFVDANILVALVNKEFPVYNYASRLVSLPASAFKLYTSPICLAIAFYFAEKKSGSKAAKQKMQILCNYIDIAEADKQAVQNALANKRISDFEDGLEYYAALNSKCKFIITEDKTDFNFSDIEVHDSRQFLELYFDRIVKSRNSN